MEKEKYEQVKVTLEHITPDLVMEVSELFENDPDLVRRYGPGLHRLAEQEVIRFRTLLLGALQFDSPGILSHELKWLEPVVTIRNYNLETVRQHILHFRSRLNSALAAEYLDEVLKVFDDATRPMLQAAQEAARAGIGD